MTTLFIYYKVACKFTWDMEDDSCSTYSFGSYEGAKEWADTHAHELEWYSIEGLSAHPCDENNVCGQLYYGMIMHEFYEVKKNKEVA